MPYRLTKIYTRKGDDGYTTLRDERLPKDDLLVETIGTIDELNAAIGFTLSLSIENKDIIKALTQVQHDLFDLGGELHAPQHPVIQAEKIKQLENHIDEWNKTLPPLKEFILPGGNSKTAACHLARTICRRAERMLVKLHRQSALDNTELLRYVNRLSDVLFVAARMLAKENNAKEVLWEHERR